MKYEFKVYRMQVEQHLFWVAESKVLKGCVGQGDTSDEAIQELSANENEWLITAKEYGIPIPPETAQTENHFSGKMSLRMSRFVHEEAAKNAQEQGVSLNQYVNDAIVNYNALCRVSVQNNSTNITAYSETSATVIDFVERKKQKQISINMELEEM